MNKLLDFFLKNDENKNKELNEIVLDWMREEAPSLLLEKEMNCILSHKQESNTTYFYMDPFLIAPYFSIHIDGNVLPLSFSIRPVLRSRSRVKVDCLNIDQRKPTKYSFSFKCLSCGKLKENLQTKDLYHKMLDAGLVCKHCKKTVAHRTNETISRYSHSMNEKYGCSFPIQSSELKKTIRKTMFKRYGCETSFNNGILRDKANKTIIKKYGKGSVSYGGGSSSLLEGSFIEQFLMKYSKLYPIGDLYCRELNKQYFVDTANGRRRLDLYIKSKKIAIQVHGDFWHGNPEAFPRDKINPILKKSYGEIYEETLKIDQEILDTKKVDLYIVVWEKTISYGIYPIIDRVIELIEGGKNGSFYL
jgi:transcription elongation factor Elf1